MKYKILDVSDPSSENLKITATILDDDVFDGVVFEFYDIKFEEVKNNETENEDKDVIVKLVYCLDFMVEKNNSINESDKEIVITAADVLITTIFQDIISFFSSQIIPTDE